ncbi:hypothetical protein JVU11DRAFT_4069 [Chiua virens]|nr:hypothetical protein JVU11DRAFT_4069 [Chiua virens]
MHFDPFRRFRFRSPPAPTLPSPTEEDSDESSPERDCPRPILSTRGDRKSGDRFLTIPDDAKLSHGRLTESTPIALSFDKPPHAERPSKRPSKPVAADDPVDTLQPPSKSTLIRRVTSKLHISIPSRSASYALRSRPSTRTLPEDIRSSTHEPRSPKPAIVASPTLPNSIVSKEKRDAALRERGLLPPRKDLSEQEREADERLGFIPTPTSATADGTTEAELLKASWLSTNRTSWCGDSGSCTDELAGIDTPSSLHARIIIIRGSFLRGGYLFVDPARERRSCPALSRPSMSSSVPPLSTSSCLEVLHEDPAEQGPITPLPLVMPPPLPIIVTSPMEYPPSSVIVESPVSCSFSSHCPGSTLESQSQSDHRSMAEKENMRSRPHRSRSRSLSNLRRSVAGSLRIPSSSTLSSADLPTRAPISPTMHSIGSIIRETRDIADAESRRLSELAFLD